MEQRGLFEGGKHSVDRGQHVFRRFDKETQRLSADVQNAQRHFAPRHGVSIQL